MSGIHQGQETIDGHTVNTWQVRFAGTLDIPEEETHLMGLDRVVFWLCASRIGDPTFRVLGESGDVRRKNVAVVSDAAVLTGKLREQAVQFIAYGAEQGVLDVPQERWEAAPGWVHVDEVEQALQAVYADYDIPEDAQEVLQDLLDGLAAGRSLPEGVSPTTGEIREDLEDLEDPGHVSANGRSPEGPLEEGPETGPVEQLGHVDDRPQPASPPSRSGSGPKVGKFRPDAGPPGEQVSQIETVEQHGSIYPNGHTGKDKILKTALESEDAP